MARGKKKANAKTNKTAKQNKTVAAAEMKEPVTAVAESAETTAKVTVAGSVVEMNAEQAVPTAVEILDAPKKEDAAELVAPDQKIEEGKAPAKKGAAKKAAKPAAKKAEAAKVTEAKRPGRKPMTEQEKAEAKKERDAKKAAAANMKPKFVLQFQGQDADLEQLAEAAAADFKAKRKRTPLTELTIYMVPEKGTAYYVANGNIEGSIPM